MFTTALVALDLSPAERPIIDCIADLRRWGVGRVVLAHVVPIGYAQGGGLGHEQEYNSWLERCAAPLRAEGLQVTIALRASGTPAQEILRAAQETIADLIVVGSRSQNMVRALFLGSVAREVIRRTPLPVLLQWIEPTPEETQARCEAVCRDMLEHVLLATDFSTHAARAEAVGVALAVKADQTDCLTVLTPAAVDATPALPLMTRAALDAIVARVTAAGGRAEAIVAEGEPAETIARIAQERRCSLLLVGKQGQNWVRGKLIGSTAAKLCETARRPVLMVPLA